MIANKKYKLTRVYKGLILSLLVFFCFQSCQEKDTIVDRSRPNVILIMSDDQGYGDFGCHGNPYLQTPNMDQLFEESVSCSNFHVDPTCAPTRAALMTGRYSSRVGVWKTFKGRHHLRQGEATMAEVFQANGYETGIFGKWHLGDNFPFRPMDRGFQTSLIHGGGVIGEAPDYWGNDYYDDTYFRNGKPEKTKGYCTDVWFEAARQFIMQKREEPFFVYLPLNAPHGPFKVPKKYVDPYLDNPDIPEKRAWMYGMVASIDENLGALRQFLREQNLEENTILIYMTDNGTASGVTFADGKAGFQVKDGYNAGMRGRKTTPYEGGHRAAFMIRWPKGGLATRRNVPQLTAHLDVLPTLVDLAGLDWLPPAPLDGKSLADILQHPESASWTARNLLVHNQVSFGTKAVGDQPEKYRDFCVMTERWRLVGDQLFDIHQDPGQRQSLSDSLPDKAQELKQVYEEWWEDIDDQFDEYCRTIIGAPQQKEVKLDCQFWHGETALYNQRHVRNGIKANGFWDLSVAKPGTYRISLRRWPKELDLAMDAAYPTPPLNPELEFEKDFQRQLPSRVLQPTKAKLKLGAFEASASVIPGQKEVTFQVDLAEGDIELQTWLRNANGEEWGAYYVYITPIEG